MVQRLLMLILVSGIVSLCAEQHDTGAVEDYDHAFSHKLFFSETPQIGRPWRGGIRFHDIIVWDGYFNINRWFEIDLLSVGIGNLHLEEDKMWLRDRFSVLTIKSCPLVSEQIFDGIFEVAGGLKFYSAQFAVDSVKITSSESGDEDVYGSRDGSVVLFAPASYRWKSRHFINVFTSFSIRGNTISSGEQKVTGTWYLVPGYRYRISKRWFSGFEYYMTNSEYLPLKSLQMVFDKDNLEFYNPERLMVSFMIWGIQFSGKHFYFDLSIANHISFQQPIIPLIGFGWDF